jgi:hypothetical protein
MAFDSGARQAGKPELLVLGWKCNNPEPWLEVVEIHRAARGVRMAVYLMNSISW